MSLKGKMLGMGAEFRDAIQQASKHGLIDHHGSVFGTARVIGYVCAIHDENDSDESLRGTVDVQEYNCEAADVNGDPIGFHQGVFLSAIQNNASGYYIVPQLFSDVVIQQAPNTLEEYVVMYSHVSIFKLQTTSEITNTVTEYEEFAESSDGLENDYDELEETGNKSSVTQTANGFVEDIVNKDGDKLKKERTAKGFVESVANKDGDELKEEGTAKGKDITIGDTKIHIEGDKVTIETSGNVTFKVGGSTIEEKDGTINIKTDTANIKTSTANVEGNDVTVKGSNVKITGGNLTVNGTTKPGQGPFNTIPTCPFSGVPHAGNTVSGT